MKLTLSYAGFLTLAGIALFGVLLLVLSYLPDENLVVVSDGGFAPRRTDLMDVAVPLAFWGTAFLALLGLGGGWLLASLLLRPLDRIGEAARTAANGTLSHRIALEGPSDELRDLADTFDQMLARLESSFAEQRRFTANASHELRTPQTVVRTMLQVARAAPDAVDVDKLLGRLEEMNERSIITLDALLLLARVQHGDLVREPCDLVDVATDALELAQPEQVRLLTSFEPAPVHGNRALLTQLAANLLRNAVIHNRPSDGTIWLEVATDRAGHPTLLISNTGPLLSPEIAATLTEPFVRAQGRVRSEGSGLGLTIASSIAQAHHAELELTPRPEGGLTVCVRFPKGQPRADDLR